MSESKYIDHLEYYILLDEIGEDLSETEFNIHEDHVEIRQPVPDEEDNKYIVMREDVDPYLWDMFCNTFG